MKAADRDSRIENELVAPLREARPTLDELHRARLAGAIEAALDLEKHAPARRRAPRAAALGGLLAAAAIALVTGLTWRSPRRPTPPARPAPATVARNLPGRPRCWFPTPVRTRVRRRPARRPAWWRYRANGRARPSGRACA